MSTRLSAGRTFDRRCEGPKCGKVFPAARRTARYCSAACRKRAQRAGSVTLTREGTIPHGPASDQANPQVSGTECHANSRISDLPAHLSQVDRDRWVAILTSPGTAGYPGDCVVSGCKQAQVHVDGLCMTHLIETGRREKRLR